MGFLENNELHVISIFLLVGTVLVPGDSMGKKPILLPLPSVGSKLKKLNNLQCNGKSKH